MNGKKSIKESTQEYARGIAGGLLFSFPVLFTMEVWWAGYESKPLNLLIMMAVTFVLLLAYNRYAGMRPGVAWKGVVIDSVEEMGIGLLISFAMMLLLRRIDLLEMSVSEVMGKVIVEAMFVSIGVSIGTAQLGESAQEPEEEKDQKLPEKEGIKQRSEKMAVAALALCGSIVVGGNVAPTDEVVVIALKAQPYHILIMVVVSCLLSVLVTYFSDFRGTRRDEINSLVYHIIFDTCLCYALALVASAFTLWYFGRFDGLSLWNIVAECVVLGIISSLGASAGRLLIK